ncbi:MAG: hypothetical protein WCG97_01565 [bacterium]
MSDTLTPEIVPAIIPVDFYELEDKVAQVAGHVRYVHIDVCDGIFVGNTSWPWLDDKIFSQIITGEMGFPQWEDVDYEVHLMTAHPEKDIFEWIVAGAYRITVQIESFFPHFGKASKGDDTSSLVNANFDERGLARFAAMLERLKTDHGFDPENEDDFYQVGISVTLDTPLEVIKPLVEKFNFVQVMSIPHIGFQGAKFDERAYERIAELREYIATLPNKKEISVDGGINEKNALKLFEAGTDRLVIGSTIFKHDIPSVEIDTLKALFR